MPRPTRSWAQIAAQYRAGDRGPVILIGHSLGADAVMTMAQALNRDGVSGGAGHSLRRDRFLRDAKERRLRAQPDAAQLCLYASSGASSHGRLTNVNVSGDSGIDHFTIDKSPRLQAQALNSVLRHGKVRAPAGPASAIPPRPSPRNNRRHRRPRRCGPASRADAHPGDSPDFLRLMRSDLA